MYCFFGAPMRADGMMLVFCLYAACCYFHVISRLIESSILYAYYMHAKTNGND